MGSKRTSLLLALLAAAGCSGEPPHQETAVDYCELPNAQADLGCSEENHDRAGLLACERTALQQSVRPLGGIPEACRRPGAPRRFPA